jgi:hypothetical protein
MNGTYEQYRISGTVYPIEKDTSQCKLDKQDNPIKTPKEASLTPEPLSLQAFLSRQKGDSFDWEAERLRQFMEFESNLRAELITSKEKRLEIPSISESGWFQNQEYQDLLDESFDNFVLLIIKVTSVVYWSPSTGIIKQL